MFGKYAIDYNINNINGDLFAFPQMVDQGDGVFQYSQDLASQFTDEERVALVRKHRSNTIIPRDYAEWVLNDDEAKYIYGAAIYTKKYYEYFNPLSLETPYYLNLGEEQRLYFKLYVSKERSAGKASPYIFVWRYGSDVSPFTFKAPGVINSVGDWIYDHSDVALTAISKLFFNALGIPGLVEEKTGVDITDWGIDPMNRRNERAEQENISEETQKSLDDFKVKAEEIRANSKMATYAVYLAILGGCLIVLRALEIEL